MFGLLLPPWLLRRSQQPSTGSYGIPRGTACLASWLKGSLCLALFHPPRVAKPRHDDLRHPYISETRPRQVLSSDTTVAENVNTATKKGVIELNAA